MWEIAHYSEKGTRMSNEDCISIAGTDMRQCLTIADGVGGHGGGGTASRTVTMMMQEVFEAADTFAPEQLRRALEEVNGMVLRMQTSRCRLQATCVTLWLARVEKDLCQAMWAHVGDSRLYRFHNGKMVFRTRDHSVLEQCKKEGVAAPKVTRNVIWQAMGEKDGIQPDIEGPVLLNGGRDAFLLCTDGLWETLEDEEIERILNESSTPDEWLKGLKNGMAEQEEYDNNSAVAVFVDA